MSMAVSASLPSVARPDRPQLPERVDAAIRSEQDRSEILIGWIQLAVITTFAVLYFISPKTAGAAGYITVAAIAVYVVLTVLRLIISHLISMPAWMLVLSVVVDMTLLFGLIWSFHLQYDQPPSFYLKAPTLLYVFIFIALRALRFDARFVILAGCLAALGWLVMAGYAIRQTGMEMITRDYVYYMTSNSILIGAEFDKIASILVVTAIIATAVIRSRRLLERTVAESFAVQDLSRFFAPEIARRIVAQGEDIVAGAGEARDAAVLYVDVRNFTRLAQKLPPDAVMQILAEFQARLVPVIRRHGGVVDKFLGDGIMATFGAASPSETFAADALGAMDELMAEARRWSIGAQEGGGVPLQVNGGVASGRNRSPEDRSGAVGLQQGGAQRALGHDRRFGQRQPHLAPMPDPGGDDLAHHVGVGDGATGVLPAADLDDDLGNQGDDPDRRLLAHFASWCGGDVDPHFAIPAGQRNGNDRGRIARTLPRHGGKHRIAVRAEHLVAAVNHRLRRVDLAVAAARGVIALALGAVRRAQRVAPSEVVPVVDVERQGDDALPLTEFGQQGIGRRRGRAALTGKQLNHDRPPLRLRAGRAQHGCGCGAGAEQREGSARQQERNAHETGYTLKPRRGRITKE
jgi:adenylate cyclase